MSEPCLVLGARVMPCCGNRALRSANAGFSLVELAIVLTLIAIMAAVAIPDYGAYMRDNRLNGAARVVMTDLLYARSQAANQNVAFKVVFSGDGYSIVRDDDGQEEARSRDIRNAYFDVSVSSSGEIVFQPNGTAGGTTVTLSNPKEDTREVIVSSTGRVKIGDND